MNIPSFSYIRNRKKFELILILTFSETEKYGVFEAINKFLLDPHSEIHSAQLLHHHWEQPHTECAGSDCKFCIRVSFQVMSIQNVPHPLFEKTDLNNQSR